MDQNTINQIRKYVAGNELEKAIDLMIGFEEGKGRERFNTLMLLKGRLDMLEEQEHAGLLDFDELARQKMKIAHNILRMTEDDGSPVAGGEAQKHVEVNKTVSSNTGSPIMKYLIMGALGMVLVLLVYNMVQPTETTVADEHHQTESTRKEETEANQEAADKPVPSRRVEQKKNEQSPVAPPTVVEDDKKEEKKETPVQPVKEEAKLRLVDFPNIGRPFNFGDIRYTFTGAEVEAYSDTEVKLTLKMDLLCRSNLGNCYREEARITVDGNPVAPTERKAWEGYMDHNTSTKEVLVFVFEKGSRYLLSLEKNSSKWERAFKVL